MTVITVETDATGAADLAEAARKLPEARFDTRKVQAQVGDPDTWTFVTQVALPMIGTLGTVLVTLIRQRKIGYVKVGDIEFRDVTTDQITAVKAALGQPDDG